MPAKSSLPDSDLSAQRIIESAGAQWVGPQKTPKGTILYFREPVTGTTLALYEQDLNVSAVKLRMKKARARFGAKVQP